MVLNVRPTPTVLPLTLDDLKSLSSDLAVIRRKTTDSFIWSKIHGVYTIALGGSIYFSSSRRFGCFNDYSVHSGNSKFSKRFSRAHSTAVIGPVSRCSRRKEIAHSFYVCERPRRRVFWKSSRRRFEYYRRNRSDRIICASLGLEKYNNNNVIVSCV